MPKSSDVSDTPSPPYQCASLKNYLAEVRKVLLAGQLRPEWVDELMAGDAQYLNSCFEYKHHPADAASEVFITEEDSNRVPEQEDQRLKIDINHQIQNHLMRLVESGLFGDTIEAAARLLIEQSLVAKVESGFLRFS